LLTLLWIAVAGAAGTVARYGVQRISVLWMGAGFPWGTLVANALGCFLFGWIAARSLERGLMSPELAIPLLTGFLGAFTTFSTFAFETGDFMRQGAWGLAAANLLLNQVLGLGLFFLGSYLGRGPEIKPF
jgi:CrcB protein